MGGLPRILLVEDDEYVARAVVMCLRTYADVVVCPSVSTARTACVAAEGCILDVGLPDGDGLDVLRDIRARGLFYPVMVLTGFRDAGAANVAFDLRAYYCEKPVDRARLVRFITELRAPTLLKLALERWTGEYRLTESEVCVLELAATGYSYEQIAVCRGVTRETVKAQVRSLLAKTGDDTLLYSAIRVLRESMQGGRE